MAGTKCIRHPHLGGGAHRGEEAIFAFFGPLSSHGTGPLLPQRRQNTPQVRTSRIRFHKRFETVKELIKNGVDPNTVDKYGRTALQFAKYRRDDQMSKYLLGLGAK